MKLLCKEMKAITQFAIPFIAMLISQKILQLVSALMLGVLGVDALAAGILSTSVYLIFIIFGIGFLNTVGIFIAESYGAKDDKSIRARLAHGFYVAFFLAIISMFILYYIPDVLLLLGQDNVVVQLCTAYMRSITWGLPALLFFSVWRELLAALQQQKIVTRVTLLAIPVNVIMNIFLVRGAFGELTIFGVGIVNAATEWFMLIAIMVFIRFHSTLRSYLTLSLFNHVSSSLMLKLCRVGIPNGITTSFEVIMSAVLTLMMGYFGAISLAAHQIAFQCVTTVYMIPLGISLAIGLRISHLIGEQRAQNIKSVLYSGLSLGIIFSLILFPLFLLAPTFLIDYFIHLQQENYDEVKNLAIAYLYIGGFFITFDALQGILCGCLRGLKDTWMMMLISIFSYLLMALGGGYLLAFQFGLAGQGLWWGLAMGLAFSSLLLLLRVRNQIALLPSPGLVNRREINFAT